MKPTLTVICGCTQCARNRGRPMAIGEWCFRDFEFVELLAKVQQQFRIESSSDLSRKNKVVIFVVTNKKRTEPDALPLRIRKSTNQKILRQLAFHLQPLL